MESKDVDRSQETGTPQKTENKAKEIRQQQEVEPVKRIRNQVAVGADMKTSMLKTSAPARKLLGYLLPAQVETHLILWPAYIWQLAAPSNSDPQLF